MASDRSNYFPFALKCIALDWSLNYCFLGLFSQCSHWIASLFYCLFLVLLVIWFLLNYFMWWFFCYLHSVLGFSLCWCIFWFLSSVRDVMFFCSILIFFSFLIYFFNDKFHFMTVSNQWRGWSPHQSERGNSLFLCRSIMFLKGYALFWIGILLLFSL